MFMNIRSAKTLVAIVLSVVFCSACVIETGGSRTGTDSRRFQCQELTELVASRRRCICGGFLVRVAWYMRLPIAVTPFWKDR